MAKSKKRFTERKVPSFARWATGDAGWQLLQATFQRIASEQVRSNTGVRGVHNSWQRCTCCCSGPDRWLDVSARKPEVTASTIVPDNTLDQGQVHTHTLCCSETVSLARQRRQQRTCGKRGDSSLVMDFFPPLGSSTQTQFQRKWCPFCTCFWERLHRKENPQCNLPAMDRLWIWHTRVNMELDRLINPVVLVL